MNPRIKMLDNVARGELAILQALNAAQRAGPALRKLARVNYSVIRDPDERPQRFWYFRAMRRQRKAGWICRRLGWQKWRPVWIYQLSELGAAALMAARGPQVPQDWNAIEGVLAFLSWLELRREKVTLGHGHKAPVERIALFANEQNLVQTREGWQSTMIPPMSGFPNRAKRREEDSGRGKKRRKKTAFEKHKAAREKRKAAREKRNKRNALRIVPPDDIA